MIVTLCGSARFEPWFHAWNEALSIAGHCVFGLAAYPSRHAGKKNWYSIEEKHHLDEVHRNKIAASDAVFILNVFGYVGESTLGEIQFAKHTHRRVFYLEPWSRSEHPVAHFGELVEKQAKAFNVPRDYKSPIDTSLKDGSALLDLSPFAKPGTQLRGSLYDRLVRELRPLRGWKEVSSAAPPP